MKKAVIIGSNSDWNVIEITFAFGFLIED